MCFLNNWFCELKRIAALKKLNLSQIFFTKLQVTNKKNQTTTESIEWYNTNLNTYNNW